MMCISAMVQLLNFVLLEIREGKVRNDILKLPILYPDKYVKGGMKKST